MAAAVRNIPADLLQVFRASYTAVLPQNIIRKRVQYCPHKDSLQISGKQISIIDKKLYVVGAGKGVQYLARELDTLLGQRIERGIVSIPVGSLDRNIICDRIEYYEGAKNNLPDENSARTAKCIKELASSLTYDDVLLVLITGGGSALLPLPIEPITLEEKTQLIRNLANYGADIKELNAVRKRLSAIKGGKLAHSTAARIVTLIISDIVDDPFDLIASGPTVNNSDNPQLTIDILRKYNLYDKLPDSIAKVLQKESFCNNEEIPSSVFQNYIEGLKVNKDNEFENVNDSDDEYPKARVLNFLLASNSISVHHARRELNLLNAQYIHSNQLNRCFFPIDISRCVTGNVKDVAKMYYKLIELFGDFLREHIDFDTFLSLVNNIKIPGINIVCDFEKLKDSRTKEKVMCLILAGETTVEVTGNGIGGRNQHLALEFSKLLHNNLHNLDDLDIYILSAGTDGIDGPTPAAGAFGHVNLFTEAFENGIDPNEYLDNNDTYNFYNKFKDGEYHIITGHTNTNVMDIQLITIKRTETFIKRDERDDSCEA